MVLSKRHYLLLCALLSLANAYEDEFAEDYFFSTQDNFLRTSSCGSKSQNFLCGLSCPKYHVCLNRQCLCVDSKKSITRTYNSHETASNDFNVSGFIDLTKSDNDKDYAPKPALRHHITHFCPNLDVARSCTNKCAKEGKPAFCGKDHHCYCGHRYNESTKDNNTDAKEMYGQFKDLYKKYFGDKYRVHSGEKE